MQLALDFAARHSLSPASVFYLGTHRINWLALTNVPLFVSVAHFHKRRSFPRALGPWAQDSSGFTQLSRHGYWTFGAKGYVDVTRRAADGIGMPVLVSIQDWMCEPFVLANTGKTIAEHQALTIESYLTLRELAPEIPWMPVLQGWECDDYLDHIEQYRAAGVELSELPVVGVGSICRRQASSVAARIIRAIALHRIRIHAFGVKTDGLRMFGDWITSADSMAWSFVARRRPVLMPGCVGHKNCANCLRWALEWRSTRIPQEASCSIH